MKEVHPSIVLTPRGLFSPVREKTAMTKSSRQCQAVVLASTYSSSHRCLKRHGVQKTGLNYLCSHHRTAAARIRL